MHDAPLIPEGTTIAGRYDIVRTVGRGAFGRTYLAHDRLLHREVAIKLLDPRGTADWKARELFEREALVLRALRHHGVPEIIEATDVEWEGRRSPLLVMEYVAGRSIADIIEARQSMDPADVLRLLLELLGVLEYLHGRVPPVLHRDIKPANVIVRDDGTPVLVDFGSVRQIFLGAHEEGSTVAGTYGYMPYEQYMGQASPSSDLFSVGATFLHLLTGRAPREFMDADGRIALPDALPGDARLQPVLARLLRASPQERFQSARETRRALLAPGAGVGASAVGPASPPSAPRANVPTPLPALPALPALLRSPAPRELDEEGRALLAVLAPSMWDYMDTTSKPSERGSMIDRIMLVAASLVTLGVYPATFFAIARARRRTLRRFLREGQPATGRILRIESEETAFLEKVARVHYEFEADGARHRDSDRVLPLVAGRWELQDAVALLYIPGNPYDSVIVGGH